MNETGKFDAGNVPTGTIDAFNVPNGLGGFGVVVRQEPASIFLGKGTRKAPFVAVESAQSEELNLQQIAGLGRRDFDGS